MRLLERVGGVEHAVLAERGAGDLQADGQPVGEAAGDRDRGDAGERHGHGAEVVEVHGERVGGLLAQLERDGGRGGSDDQVDLREGGAEVLGDLRAHALGAAVVGVVVAGGERVGAEHDAALDLCAEAVVARARVHVEQVGGVGGAQPVAHAVEAGEVGGGLGGGEHVVGGQRVRGVRELDLADLSAELLGTGERRAEGVEHARFDALAR